MRKASFCPYIQHIVVLASLWPTHSTTTLRFYISTFNSECLTPPWPDSSQLCVCQAKVAVNPARQGDKLYLRHKSLAAKLGVEHV